jgi:hypothetical protein
VGGDAVEPERGDIVDGGCQADCLRRWRRAGLEAVRDIREPVFSKVMSGSCRPRLEGRRERKQQLRLAVEHADPLGP